MKIYILAIYVLIIFVFSFCKKDHDHEDHNHDTEKKISMNWAQPAEGSRVKFGDTLRIEGIATHSSEMHGYEVAIYKASDTSTVLYPASEHTHGTELKISKKWVCGLSDSTKLLVKLTVAKSHSGTDNEVFRRTVWAVK
jgi:hypothetical protein